MNDSQRSDPLAPLDVGLERLPADTDPDKVADVLRRDGGLIIEGLVTPTAARAIDAELAPHVEGRHAGFNPEFDDVFYGSNTKRIQGLAAKSRTFVHEILLNRVLLDLADRILLPSCGDYWMSQAETIFIGPGNGYHASRGIRRSPFHKVAGGLSAATPRIPYSGKEIR